MDWSIFAKKRVIITGHSGFKGSWLMRWLSLLGSDVTGLSIGIPTKPSNFNILRSSTPVNDIWTDINNEESLEKIFKSVQPNFVFHFAAQSLVSESFVDPYKTFNTNVIGSINVMKASINCGSSPSVIMVTSDKCYKNKGKRIVYKEEDELGGEDPYSASKAACEILIKSLYLSLKNSNQNNIKLAICRAGNSIGGGDWSEARIVPDCIRAWSLNEKLAIRSPDSIRPWQHVLDSIGGYLLLIEKLQYDKDLNGEAFNFGPLIEQEIKVETLVKELAKHWGINAKFNIEPSQINESDFLKLDSGKAYQKLGWKPVFSFKECIEMTSFWYKTYYLNKSNSIIHETDKQILLAQKRLTHLSNKKNTF